MKLLALDGNSIINRAFYGVRPLTTRDGRHTNAVFGFIHILNRLMEMETPDGVAVAFDLRAPTFRHKMYTEYKAGRKGMPDELAEQLPVLKEVLAAMGHHCVECEGYEADDILGTLAAAADAGGDSCVISTGDRDSLQLVSPSTRVLLAATRQGRPEIVPFDEAAIREKYGVTPPQMIELKALMGDSSDNIPGVPGVGEKTASDLIIRFHDIDYIYENLDTLDIKEGVRAKLRAGQESAYLSRKLGTIVRDVPIEREVAAYRDRPCDKPRLAALFRDLEFKKLLEKFGLEDVLPAASPSSEREAAAPAVRRPAELSEVAAAAEKEGIADLLLTEDGFALLIGAGALACRVATDRFEEMAALRSLLQAPKIGKRLPSAKGFYHWCEGQGIRPAGVCFDAEVAGYLLRPGAHSYTTDELAVSCGVTAPAEAAFPELHLHRAVCDRLAEELERQGMHELYYTIELPLTRVLAGMETAGFRVDAEGLRAYGAELAARVAALQEEIYDLVGYAFNLNSPKQLGEALFVKLGLPAKKKTKSGYSTSAEVLEELRYAHPAVELLLQYRQLAKLQSTYCDALADKADRSGRIHSTLIQTETRTGRISSAEPNLQNIPVRQEEGRLLRSFFGAADGYLLCDADYSQIELRVLAHMAEDETMIDAFLQGKDIHTITAAQVFGLPVEMVTPDLRSRAKAVNFGIVYGIGAFSLAKDIGVTRKEAEAYINGYFATYAGVKRFMERSVEAAKETGYAVTAYGRRRELPELKASNAALRSFGERVARNMPIQGTAADIIKIAMLRVSDRLEREGLDARLIMQVHDELIVEARADLAEYVCRLLEEEMAAAASLRVPLLVEAHSGKTWYDAKG